MKALNIKNNLLMIQLALITVSAPVFSETLSEPLELQAIMKDMGERMQSITAGIASEDWGLVEEQAIHIADHPQPGITEKIRILSYIGTDVSQFREYDGKTHMAARHLNEAAASEDGYAVIAGFAALQKTCLMCHQQFREAFREHFYGQPSQLD